MPFPSTLTTFTYVNPGQRLNNPSHSSVHNLVASALGQVEAVIGTSASALGTIIGDLRSASSNGGGHVQTAAKGGTGQTVFTKGDLLVGINTSTLGKLAVSSTVGEVLTADPGQAAGMRWSNAAASKVFVGTSSVSTGAGAASVTFVMYAASIAGSVLGTNNAVRYRGAVQNFSGQESFVLSVNYGNNVISSVTVGVVGGTSVLSGVIDGVIAAAGNVSAQVGYVNMDLGINRYAEATGIGPRAHAFKQMTSSVNSSANQNLVITGLFSGPNSANSILTGVFTVDKIT